MINFFLKKRGAATLLFTVVLLTLSTLVVLFATNFAVMQGKITANLNRNLQAFEAAEAGLEFGINYLKVNSAAILANPVGGFIQPFSNASTTNVVLVNNSRFTIAYTNPVASNYTRISITSTGSSDDGTSTRVIRQEVGYGSVVANPPAVPLTSMSAVSLGGNSTVRNTISNTTIMAGQAVTISGSGQTVLGSGVSSTSGNILADIQQNAASLQSISQVDFFTTYFGVTMAGVKSNISNYYNNSSDTNYSSTLNGMTGTSIWIDQTGGTAKINGNVTIGTADNPVLLIVNGNLDIMGDVVIYGFIFVLGETTTDLLGSVTLYGSMAAQSNINLTGKFNLNYDPTTLTNLRNQNALRYYAKVPGTWRDF